MCKDRRGTVEDSQSNGVMGAVLLLLLALLASGCGSRTSPLESPRQSTGFMPPEVVNVLGAGLDLKAEDLDGDGKADLLIPFLASSLALVYNDSTPGAPAFSTTLFAAGPSRVITACSGDIDSDGYPELAVLREDDEDDGLYITPVDVYRNLDGASYELLHEFEIWQGAEDMAFDLVNDDDDVPDLLLTSALYDGQAAIYFESITEPYDDGRAQKVGGYGVQEEYIEFTQMVLHDVDHNGYLDVLEVNTGDKPGLKLAMHMPVTSAPAVIFDPWQGWIIRPADYFDPTLCTNYRGSELVLDEPGAIPLRVACGDLNEDGLDDVALLVQHPSGQYFDYAMKLTQISQLATFPSHVVYIYCSSLSGPEGFESSPTMDRRLNLAWAGGLYFPGWVTDIRVADVNYDDHLDVILCSEGPLHYGGISYLAYFPGKGDFDFDPPLAFPTGGPPLRLAVADFDADSYLDAAVLLPWTNELEVRLNDGGSGLGEEGIIIPFME